MTLESPRQLILTPPQFDWQLSPHLLSPYSTHDSPQKASNLLTGVD